MQSRPIFWCSEKLSGKAIEGNAVRRCVAPTPGFFKTSPNDVKQRLKLKASAILHNSSVQPPIAHLPPKKLVFESAANAWRQRRRRRRRPLGKGMRIFFTSFRFCRRGSTKNTKCQKCPKKIKKLDEPMSVLIRLLLQKKQRPPRPPTFSDAIRRGGAHPNRSNAGPRCCDLDAGVRCILVGKVVQKQVPKRQSLGDARVYSELHENVLRQHPVV